MINKSAGKVSAEMVAGYPPGIPCLMPGEMITEEIVEYIICLQARNISLHGLRNPERQMIDIVEV
jgi:lysine decarboxylase